MGLFSRRSTLPTQRHLVHMLTEWGQCKFEGGDWEGNMSAEAKQFKYTIMDMGFNRDSTFPTRLRTAIQEIREAGLREGGWTVVGAWEAVDMMHAQFGDLHPPEDVMRELLEARVRFLQTLNEPKFAMQMNNHDMGLFLHLFPDDYARMFPHRG